MLEEHSPTPNTEAPPVVDDRSLSVDSTIIGASSDVRGLLPKGSKISCRLAAQISIPLKGLPSKLIAALKKTATFPNPEFYKLQRMRMATYPHPRLIFSGELRSDELILPRGVADAASALLTRAGALVKVVNECGSGRPIDASFSGILTPTQKHVLAEAARFDQGVIVAPPGEGKTVIACALIAQRGTSTLILVHKQPLVEQWKKQLSSLLGIPVKEIGLLGGARKTLKGRLDIAMLQSLAKSDDVEQIASSYGQLIVDECHHVPAISFEAVMKRFSPKFVLGLTATPRRKDGLERLLFQQCGPIRHEVKLSRRDQLRKVARIRDTGYVIPAHLGAGPPYHVMAEFISKDESRNLLVAHDIVDLLTANRFPLVIADRKGQVKELVNAVAELWNDTTVNSRPLEVFHLDGTVAARKRRETLEHLERARAEGGRCVLFATAALVGEGVDIPELDALVLASPVSFEGRLVQYAGRLHRQVAGKSDVVVLDYVDPNWIVSMSMYRNRLKAYKKMGYSVDEPEWLCQPSFGRQPTLF